MAATVWARAVNVMADAALQVSLMWGSRCSTNSMQGQFSKANEGQRR